MFKKLLTATLVAATVAGASLSATGSAEARYGRHGAFAAGAVLGLLGGALVANSYSYAEPTYYAPYCFWKRIKVHDGYGYYHFERVRVCR